MRTINLNGYIDEEVFYGDEITPAMLHDALYGENGEFSDDVRIILNSYGGSCNAAVRMHDDIRAYPGRVHLVISGTAASAATVLSAAADTLEMTPGSLYMIHDPSTVAWGNERDFGEAIALLKACKERKIAVPEEIGIVAFDNYPLAEYTEPQLTIVDIDTSLLGEQAAQLLFQRIDSRIGNQQIMLSTVLVPRASSERKGRK